MLRKSACKRFTQIVFEWKCVWRRGITYRMSSLFFCMRRVSATLLLAFLCFCFILDTTICLLFFALMSIGLVFSVCAVVRTLHSSAQITISFQWQLSPIYKNNEFHSIYISGNLLFFFFGVLQFDCPETTWYFQIFGLWINFRWNINIMGYFFLVITSALSGTF